ncbi:MAG: recombination mediator RecR [Pseudomonadota bacterium]
MSTQSPLQNLVRCLSGLPGIGEKTATRLALHIITCPKENALELAQSIIDAREKIFFCRQCFNYSDRDLCSICASANREPGFLCVVENPGDLMSIEKTGWFKGKYHVLHGAIAPLDGIGPDQLRIKELLRRIEEEKIAEVILATNPTMNGNATAVYIAGLLRPGGVTISRIAQGIPPGGDIGYADQMTLKNALEGRREMK